MRRLFFSLFLGFGSAFVAWAASFAVFDLLETETAALTEHKIVIGVTAAIAVFGLVTMRSIIDAGVTALAAVGGVAVLWDARSFPENEGYSTEYWAVVVVSTLVFMSTVVLLHSHFLFRSKRTLLFRSKH